MSVYCPTCVVYDQHGRAIDVGSASSLPAHLLLQRVVTADYQEPIWIKVINTIHFYVLPSLVTFGLVFGLFNCIVLLRNVKTSQESFLTALSLGSTLLLLCTTFLHLPHYIPTSPKFPILAAYLSGIINWLWYSCVWITVVMAAERNMSAKHFRRRSFCGSVQAGVACLMVVLVCLVSAVPQFWQYRLLKTTDLLTNRSSFALQETAAARRPEFRLLYRWFIFSSSLLLAVPVTVILVVFLCVGARRYEAIYKRTAKHGSGTVLMTASQQLRLNRLYIVLLVLHLLLTTALPLLDMVPAISGKDKYLQLRPAYRALRQLFTLLFYTYFPVMFLLFCCFLEDYRVQLRRCCCAVCHRCTCCQREYGVV